MQKEETMGNELQKHEQTTLNGIWDNWHRGCGRGRDAIVFSFVRKSKHEIIVLDKSH